MNTGHHTPEVTDDRSASLSCLSYRVPTSQRKHKIKQTLSSRIKGPHEHELYTSCLPNNPTSVCICFFSFDIFTNSFQLSWMLIVVGISQVLYHFLFLEKKPLHGKKLTLGDTSLDTLTRDSSECQQRDSSTNPRGFHYSTRYWILVKASGVVLRLFCDMYRAENDQLEEFLSSNMKLKYVHGTM